MRTMRGLRGFAALATAAGALLVAPVANAGAYAEDVHIDGIQGGGNYYPTYFHWDEPFAITFSHTPDASTGALMQAAMGHREVGNAVLHQTLLGNAAITLQMSGVSVDAVREEGGNNGPEETVVLRFRQVTYTFQTLLPNGQKSGAPVTVTWRR